MSLLWSWNTSETIWNRFLGEYPPESSLSSMKMLNSNITPDPSQKNNGGDLPRRLLNPKARLYAIAFIPGLGASGVRWKKRALSKFSTASRTWAKNKQV
jgi:hypothetical protein